MKKFKYKTIKTDREVKDIQLNQLGARGWELCGVHMSEWGYIYYLKKEIVKKDGESNI